MLLILARSVESPSKAASPVSGADATSNDSNATSSSKSWNCQKKKKNIGGSMLDSESGL